MPLTQIINTRHRFTYFSPIDQHLPCAVHIDLAVLPLANSYRRSGRFEKIANVFPVDLKELAPHGVRHVGPVLHGFAKQIVHTGDHARNDTLFLLGNPLKTRNEVKRTPNLAV